MSESEQALYDVVGRIELSDLSSSTVESALAVVLDHLTCAIVGRQMDWVQSLEQAVLPETGPLPTGARVYGEKQAVPATVAALINGTAGHGLDIDDLYMPAMIHPGAIVVAAAIAAGAAADVDGPRLLTAVVAGYEMACRVGLAVGLEAGERGYHCTGQIGPVGAAAAAIAIQDGGPAALAHTVGVASSMGAGIKAFTNGPGAVKRLHAGRAAEAGVLAARLWQQGLAGPANSLTGKFGLVGVLGAGAADAGALGRGLGEQWAVDDIYLKPYAACGALHGALAATEALVPTVPDPSRIASIVVGTSRRALAQNSDPDPQDPMSVQYSMEACVALGLMGLARDPVRSIAYAGDPDDPARSLASLVRMELDDTAEATYPEPNISRVDVRLDDGTELSTYGHSDRSTSRGWDVAVSKLHSVLAGSLSGAERDRLVTATRALADGLPVRSLLEAIPTAVGPRDQR